MTVYCFTSYLKNSHLYRCVTILTWRAANSNRVYWVYLSRFGGFFSCFFSLLCYDMGFITSRYVLSNGTPHLQPLFKNHDNQGVLSFNVTQTSRGPYCYDCYECLWNAIKIYIDIQNKYSSKWDYFWLALLNLCQWNHGWSGGEWCS